MIRVGEGPLQNGLYYLHKSLGLLIFILMIWRIAYRLIHGAPAAEPGLARWQRAVSSAVHGLLYLLLLVMPVLGYLALSAFGASTPFFGLFELPPILVKDEPLSDRLFLIHRGVGFLIALLAVVHIGAALQHHFMFKDGVLRRMLPRALGGR
jgi:cytochrome b561